MKTKQILFTEPNVARLVETEIPDQPQDEEVLVATRFTAISTGTERANLIGEKNISGLKAQCEEIRFPRALGYSGAGLVEKVGPRVTSVEPGDRVVIYCGLHRQHNLVNQSQLVKIRQDSIPLIEAAFCVIAAFPLAGIRKTRFEIGESAMVVGLGILGLLAVQLYRAAGAVPVLAVDPNPDRRGLARQQGADYALDPTEPDFVPTVKHLTQGAGVNSIVEVSGVAAALCQALDCAARFGRVALLGCTRTPDASVDFYHQVHYPGVTLVGAHNLARPHCESYPGNWTFVDDCEALLKLMATGKLALAPLISEVHPPAEAPAVYQRLAYEPHHFPVGVAFDWTKLE